MENITLVSDLVWIPRGVAKSEPITLKIESEKLKELIKDDKNDDETDEENDSNEIDHEMLHDEDIEKEEKSDETEGNMMKGIAVYADNKDDELLKNIEDSEDEAEKDDFVIRPNDNLLVVAKIVKDEPTLDVHVFNKDDDDYYVHHNYFLSSPPLCLTKIGYDPGSESGKGNLIAVGSFDPTIDIWDIDIANSLEPVMVLGKQKLEKRKKRDNSAQGHSDAVTCLDWNVNAQHVLASGSADKTVVLWDLDEAKPATILNCFDDKLGAVKWHPENDTILLAGTKSGKIQIIGCQNMSPESNAAWNLEGEIEKIIWDIKNNNCVFATTDDGKLYYLDSRQPGKIITSVDAHEGGANAIAQNIYGMIATVGENEMNIWKLNGNEFQQVCNYPVRMGKLFAVSFNPDIQNTLVIGGESEEMARIIDLEKNVDVRRSFPTVFEDAEMIED